MGMGAYSNWGQMRENIESKNRERKRLTKLHRKIDENFFSGGKPKLIIELDKNGKQTGKAKLIYD